MLFVKFRRNLIITKLVGLGIEKNSEHTLFATPSVAANRTNTISIQQPELFSLNFISILRETFFSSLARLCVCVCVCLQTFPFKELF